jgi:hypothetical protein
VAAQLGATPNLVATLDLLGDPSPIFSKLCKQQKNKGNNFNSDVAKRWVFLPTTHMLPPHIKRKKCKQKLYFLPHENMTHRRWCRRKKREKRERRERRRRKKEDTVQTPATETLRWVSPTVGLRDPRYFFFFFLSVIWGRISPEG